MFDAPSFRRYARLAIAGCSLLAAAPAARAGFIGYKTPAGSMAGGQPVDATAVITTGNGTISITLTNSETNPISDIQSINGIIFTLSNNPTSVTLAGSSAVQRTIAGNSTYMDSATPLSTNWTVGFSSPTVTLTTIGNPMAKETIIGGPAADNKYDAANSSIAGANHNPFLAETATFTLSAPGVTSSTTISSLSFAFGTSSGTNVVGTSFPVPEPSSIALLILGAGTIGLIARRRLAVTAAA